MNRAVGLALAFAVTSACARDDSVPAGYAARIKLALVPGADSVAGRLELLEDARIQPAMREAIRQAWGGDPCADHPDLTLRSLCAAPGHAPLRPALLRLLEGAGRTVATRAAERPLADLSVTHLYATPRRTYLFTVDLNAGMGSYSGPYTRLAEPTSEGFGWVLARARPDSGPDTLTLVSTLKTAWRAVPRADGRGNDFLMVRCRPDFDAPDSASDHFLLTLERFHFEGRQWLDERRQERGCWEEEDPFPNRARFP